MENLFMRMGPHVYRGFSFFLLLTITCALFPATALAKKNSYLRQELTGYVLRYKGELIFTEQPDSTFTLYSLEFRDLPRNSQKFCEYQDYHQCSKETISFSQVIKLHNQFQLTDVVLDNR